MDLDLFQTDTAFIYTTIVSLKFAALQSSILHVYIFRRHTNQHLGLWLSANGQHTELFGPPGQNGPSSTAPQTSACQQLTPMCAARRQLTWRRGPDHVFSTTRVIDDVALSRRYRTQCRDSKPRRAVTWRRSIFENCFARGLITKKVSKKDKIAKISCLVLRE